MGNRKKGHMFINERTGKRLTLRHFEKMIDKWAAEHPETSVHQAERQGIPSDHINGTEGKRHHDGGDSDVSAKAAGHNKETKARNCFKVRFPRQCNRTGQRQPLPSNTQPGHEKQEIILLDRGMNRNKCLTKCTTTNFICMTY
jgi:hypothetical protein